MDDFAVLTQQTLGSLISRPKLTPKYLVKPPFRFLHDIVTEVIRTTGFAKGLFDQHEKNSEHITDKTGKVSFLTKIIECVSIAINEPVAVSPNKIVAGLEAEKTNRFLVQLHQAATSAVERSDLAVQMVLSRYGTANMQKAAETPKSRTAGIIDGNAGPSNHQHEPLEAPMSPDNTPLLAGIQEPVGPAEVAPNELRLRAQPGKVQSKEGDEQDVTRQPLDVAPWDPGAKDKDIPALDRPRTAGRRPPRVDRQAEFAVQHERPGDARDESVDVARMGQGSSSPYILGEGPEGECQETADDMFVEGQPQGQVLKVDKDDTTQYGRLVQDILDTRQEGAVKVEATTAQGEGEMGGTVKGIKLGRLKRKKDAARATYDVEGLRMTLQALCQAANPLGKSVDLVHQDIATMGGELGHWRDEKRASVAALQLQIRETEDSLGPLEQDIAALEEEISHQKNRIDDMMNRVAKNDHVLTSFLHGF
ncbi:unnamed protein product [Vitrella brassicaformis CCMP3155]|uniref:TRAF3-interacting protein 1 n=1 Tax=Vitrella brassicaformis (strain CCMP3155) TaxID=1169540 RepID=A0A0G4FF46_VITBC|nr:unnamed protein product [Vitrella brassicaformis CCMP3155]|mmetsp:Transcript_1583/g.3431  ORF Transcript_1583/g.3431 Transcript_1583/m.3431 type:complete len:478 (-) Transcript_1583:133-1566(-)|eukprot:CEM11687.1 unnamed protein product [Vitrella brassicaformis CCMP3155]